jgi:transposase
MVRRGELTERAWARLRPLLPANGRRGGPWRDHRQMLKGILWWLRGGAPWRFGLRQTCDDRFVRWLRDGSWDHLLARLQAVTDAAVALRRRPLPTRKRGAATWW